MKKAICERCGKEYEYDENNIRQRDEGYKRTYDSSKYCCQRCASLHGVEKQRKTLSEKLGYEVTSTYHLPGVQDKVHETNMKKYGVAYGVCSQQSIEKRRKTSLERYGVEFALQNKEIKQKTHDSNIKNHNGVYHFNTPEMREKIAEGHRTPEYKEFARNNFDVKLKHQEFLDKYGVENPFQLEEFKRKAKETILEKYGVENVAKVPTLLQERRNSRMLNEAMNIDLLTKEYLEANYVQGNVFKLKEASDFFNLTLFAMDSFKQQLNIDVPNEESTDNTLETEFYNYIRTLTDKEIVRNNRNIIAPLELDIYIPEMKLAFEFNGDYWHSFNFNHNQKYQYHKTLECEKKGIRLIHIWEHEWLNDNEKIKLFLNSLFLRRERIRASNCEIKLISSQDFNKFAEDYHLLGATSVSTRIGLYYNDELVSALGLNFESSHSQWNLKRYIVGKYQVMGGFEKLFKYFIENYNPEKIITFVELSKFVGQVNLRNGFVVDKELAPDFFWIIKDERVDKWTAWNQLKIAEETTAEYQERVRGFALQCFDAGKRRLVWTKQLVLDI